MASRAACWQNFCHLRRMHKDAADAYTHTHTPKHTRSITHTHTDACALSSDIKIICQAQNLGQATLKQTECVSEVCVCSMCVCVCLCMCLQISLRVCKCVLHLLMLPCASGSFRSSSVAALSRCSSASLLRSPSSHHYLALFLAFKATLTKSQHDIALNWALPPAPQCTPHCQSSC